MTTKGSVMENLNELPKKKTYTAPVMVVVELKRQKKLLLGSDTAVCDDCVFQ